MTSPELLSLTSVSTGQQTSATVLGRTAFPEFAGGREPKNLIEVQFEDAAAPATLVERTLSAGHIPAWLALRQAGITVSPDIYTGIPAKQLVPDLKADGSELYGKYLAVTLEERRDRERARPEVDELFVKLLGKKERQIIDRMAHCAATATRHSIELASDDPLELIMHPDGSWDLIALDLTYAIAHASGPTSYLERHNANIVTSLEVNLGTIYTALKAERANRKRRGWFSLMTRRG